jgi:hypothetical protein
MWSGDTYRQAVVKYIRDHAVPIDGRDSYQFGIYTGNTFVFIYKMFRKYGLDVKRILAFDSFEGLPDEKPGMVKHPNWNRHEFNMKYLFQTQDTRAIISNIEKQLPDRDIRTEWYEGYFNKVLNDHFLATDPRPAFWVDLDVDLYQSTIDVLDFMIPNGLILPGTIVSMDDWGGCEEYKGGESLAWKEMIEKYRVDAKEIHSYTSGDREHCQKAFIVTEIGA